MKKNFNNQFSFSVNLKEQEKVFFQSDSSPSDTIINMENNMEKMSRAERIKHKICQKQQKIQLQHGGSLVEEPQMDKRDVQKMKNRISAQKSRDRMKQYVQEIETENRELKKRLEENHNLLAINNPSSELPQPIKYLCVKCQKEMSLQNTNNIENMTENEQHGAYQFGESNSSSFAYQFGQDLQDVHHNQIEIIPTYQNQEERGQNFFSSSYERVSSNSSSKGNKIFFLALIAIICMAKFSSYDASSNSLNSIMNLNRAHTLHRTLNFQTTNIEQIANPVSPPVIEPSIEGMVFDPYQLKQQQSQQSRLPITKENLLKGRMEEMMNCINNNLLMNTKETNSNNFDNALEYQNNDFVEEHMNMTEFEDVNNIDKYLNENDILRGIVNSEEQDGFINKTDKGVQKIPTSIFCPIAMKFNYNNSLTIMEDQDMKELQIIINSQGLVEYAKHGANFLLQSGTSQLNNFDDIILNHDIENSDQLYEISTQIIQIREHNPNPCNLKTPSYV